MGTHVFLHPLASRFEPLFNIATALYGPFNGPTPGDHWAFGIHVALLALDLTHAPATRWLTIWAVSFLLCRPKVCTTTPTSWKAASMVSALTPTPTPTPTPTRMLANGYLKERARSDAEVTIIIDDESRVDKNAAERLRKLSQATPNVTVSSTDLAGTSYLIHDDLVIETTFDWLSGGRSGREYSWHAGRLSHSSTYVEGVSARLRERPTR